MAKSKPAASLIVTPGDPGQIFPDVPVPKAFEKEGGDFIDAEEIEKVGAALIDVRKELEPLREAAIRYLWQKSGGTSAGKAVLGRCRRPRGLLAKFCAADFIITISADHVTTAQLTRFQMEALVFHELCHASMDQQKGARLLPHDYEGFNAEVTHYGAWRPDLQRAQVAFSQLQLL